MNDHAASEEAKKWDGFNIANGGNFLQSWGWASFQESLGRSVLRRAVTGKDGTVSAQYVAVSLPLVLGKRYSYVARGPVFAVPPGTARQEIGAVVESMRRDAATDGTVFTRLEWPFMVPDGGVTTEDLKPFGFEPARTRQPQHTLVMDLSKPEEVLLSEMHHKTRYNIRVAERQGVTVRDADHEDEAAFDRDISAFWNMLSETSDRDEFSTHEEGYYRAMAKALRPGNGALSVRLVLAEREGRAVAGGLFAEYGGTVTYLHGASVSAERKHMAPYLLHWTVIRRAKAAGFKEYDFWGVAPSDAADHAWAGITRFKTGFGGRRVSYLGAWELPGARPWYTLYRYAKKLRG